MSAINTYPTLTIEQVTEAIKQIGTTNTIMVMSEPGCGKSSILKQIAIDNGDQWRRPGDHYETDKYDYVYIDGPNKEMMDIAASIPNHDTKALEYYVASVFNMGNPRPKVIMIDEALKVPKLMQPIYTRMYLERTVGDVPLPEGSIVFATSNNSSDGVGDVLPAHTANRLTIVRMEKPKLKEWLKWADENGISAITRATVAMYPRMLMSYMDADQQENPYIFIPSKQVASFVSPRSLEKADHVVKKQLSEAVTLGLLAGTVGERAARDMMAFITLQDKVTPIVDVFKDPEGVTMPQDEDVAALLLMIFQALDHIDGQEKLTAFQKFVNRIKSHEIQAIWFVCLLRSPRAKFARVNKDVANWAVNNHHML
jgi:hypothetical protein